MRHVPKKITEMFAFVITEDDGGEGVIGARLAGPDGDMIPFVGADLARIENLRPFAEQIAHELGAEIRILKFSTMEIIDVIEPTSQPTKH